MLTPEYVPNFSYWQVSVKHIIFVPDMRGGGQLTCLVTGRKKKKRNQNLYVCVCNVSCAHNVKYV